ncbi:hypothetical protein HK097_000792, partial [Rhizophlyctis rosea]
MIPQSTPEGDALVDLLRSSLIARAATMSGEYNGKKCLLLSLLQTPQTEFDARANMRSLIRRSLPSIRLQQYTFFGKLAENLTVLAMEVEGDFAVTAGWLGRNRENDALKRWSKHFFFLDADTGPALLTTISDRFANASNQKSQPPEPAPRPPLR